MMISSQSFHHLPRSNWRIWVLIRQFVLLFRPWCERKSFLPTVFFRDGKQTFEAVQGETLLSCIRRSGVRVESTCDGRGVCGKCRVDVHGELSPPDDAELEHLGAQCADVRLACRAKVLGNVYVTINDTWTQLQSALGPEL